MSKLIIDLPLTEYELDHIHRALQGRNNKLEKNLVRLKDKGFEAEAFLTGRRLLELSLLIPKVESRLIEIRSNKHEAEDTSTVH